MDFKTFNEKYEMLLQEMTLRKAYGQKETFFSSLTSHNPISQIFAKYTDEKEKDDSLNGWVLDHKAKEYINDENDPPVLFSLMRCNSYEQKKAIEYMKYAFENDSHHIKNNYVFHRIIFDKFPIFDTLSLLHVAAEVGNSLMINYLLDENNKIILDKEHETISSEQPKQISRLEVVSNTLQAIGQLSKNTKYHIENTITSEYINMVDSNNQTALEKALLPLFAICLNMAEIKLPNTFADKYMRHQQKTIHGNLQLDYQVRLLDIFREQHIHQIAPSESQTKRQEETQEELFKNMVDNYYSCAELLLLKNADIKILPDTYQPLAEFILDAKKNKDHIIAVIKHRLEMIRNNYRQYIEDKIKKSKLDEKQIEEIRNKCEEKLKTMEDPTDLHPQYLMVEYFHIWYYPEDLFKEKIEEI